MLIYDITPPVTSDLGVFPGDVPYRRQISLDFNKGDHLLLSSIESTLHLGAHADGPNHYDPKGTGIGERQLDPYLGSCQVIRVHIAQGTRVMPEDVKTPITEKRVLIDTGSFPNPDRWNSDFCALSPEWVDQLGAKGVLLVGIDTPSIDPESAKVLLSHHAVAKHRMAILEGLVLKRVPEGVYTLCAPPLKLMEADASPVRALLLPAGLLPEEPLECI
ncbi:MAG: cyclase family protein [Acidobacteria bacterium]|nr:cyclase family protein [Acidobacteriota bacterium]